MNRNPSHDPLKNPFPPEVVTTLKDLIRFEYLVQAGNLLPAHPVYSLLAGRHASKLRGRGLDFEEVRPYVPGDDIRNIDWRVTARTGETHSKVFNEERERPTFIVLDQSARMFFGSQRFIKSVTAAHAAALSAFYTIKRGDRVGALVYNEEGHDYIEPRRSRAHVQYILERIAARNALLPYRKVIRNNTGLLDSILQRTASIITHDYVVTLIGDFSVISEETRRHLRNMSQSNDVILIHIYDPLETQLPDGRLVIGDGARQIGWQNRRYRWGQMYVGDFKRMQLQLQQEYRRYRIPVVFFHTSTPVEDQIKMALYGPTD